MSINPWILVALVSMSPIAELRGSIPLGVSLGLPLIKVSIISIVFNAIMFFPVIFASERICRHEFKALKVINTKIEKRARWVRKLGYPGLVGLVAIPLPITGVWTASIVAWLLKLDRRKAFLCILSGTIIAGLIVTMIILGVMEVT